MNYASHYDRLISRSYGRVLDGYQERHHILPRCLGGSDARENIALLTPEEHYVAHQLLVKIHPQSSGLALAATRMSKQCTGRKAFGWLKRRLSGVTRGKPLAQAHYEKVIAYLRSPEARAEAAKKQIGKKYSAESKEKMRVAKLGKKQRIDVVAKRAKAQIGHLVSLETRIKIADKALGNKRALGFKHSAETRAKMSAAAKIRGCDTAKMLEARMLKKLGLSRKSDD